MQFWQSFKNPVGRVPSHLQPPDFCTSYVLCILRNLTHVFHLTPSGSFSQFWSDPIHTASVFVTLHYSVKRQFSFNVLYFNFQQFISHKKISSLSRPKSPLVCSTWQRWSLCTETWQRETVWSEMTWLWKLQISECHVISIVRIIIRYATQTRSLIYFNQFFCHWVK